MKFARLSVWIIPFLACMLLCSCRCSNTAGISEVCRVKFGTVHAPRHGEGQLVQIHEAKVFPPFEQLLVEVVPFEHQVYRIILRSYKGELPAIASGVRQRYNIIMQKDNDIYRSDLTHTTIRLRPAPFMGPEAVELEFTDRVLAEKAGKLKLESRFKRAQLETIARSNIEILNQAVIDYQYDVCELPPSLAALYKNVTKSKLWAGPYTDFDGRTPGVKYVYTKLDNVRFALSYELLP